MSFFDSFSKKKGVNSGTDIGLPPPPNIESEIPIPETPSVFTPPQFNPNNLTGKKEDIIPPPIFPKAPVYQKPEETSPELTFTNKESPPLFQNIEQQTLEPPELLPRLPKTKIVTDSLEEFKLENTPSFTPADNELEELPSIEIWDSEETPYTNFRYESLRNPLFIRTDHFGEVISTIDMIKSYVEESSEVISSLETLKKNSEIELQNYKVSLEDIQRKLIYIDKVLFERGDQ